MQCQFKAVNEEMSFSAYGNTKNFEDHAGDVAVDGCYAQSIEIHKAAGTMPLLLWGHDHYSPPVGVITHTEEDTKGYLIEGKFSKSSLGKDLHILALEDALKSMSIGYNVMDEQWDGQNGINYLKSIHVKEVSFVNFACNEQSLIQTVKSHIVGGDLPSKREMEKILRSTGLSRKQAMTICSRYEPGDKSSIDIHALKGYSLFN